MTVYRIADNVLSPLGATTAENYQSLKEGRSALKHYASFSGRKEDDYVASRFTDEQLRQLMTEGLTWFESLVYHSVKEALKGCSIDVTSHRTLFVLSTTKANISHLSSEAYAKLFPAESAKRIARHFGIITEPIVVCNACISGVSAIVTAKRLIESGIYDTAIVVGCDVVSHFVVSGFQSLKALSPEPCRPFDIDRMGLNLGEAAATLVLGRGAASNERNGDWQIVSGAIRNDAYHISSPSPRGEGCAESIRYATDGIDMSSISAVNVHGTATLYNDQMESKAIEAVGLSAVPAYTLKGYFGHTLGASGILETIMTMYALDHGALPATLGFSETGVSGCVNITSQPFEMSNLKGTVKSFVKVISGFGGCNAAIYCRNERKERNESNKRNECDGEVYSVDHRVRITPHGIDIDGNPLYMESSGSKLLTEVYTRFIAPYPKYYKMDRLSQLGFVATELLLLQENPRRKQCADRAVVLFNHSSSQWVDHEYAKSIVVGEDYFPSPSLFVYTLPNIVCGEIAIRNGYRTETSFYILGCKDEAMMNDILRATLNDYTLQGAVTGWIDYQDDDAFEADIKLIRRNIK